MGCGCRSSRLWTGALWGYGGLSWRGSSGVPGGTQGIDHGHLGLLPLRPTKEPGGDRDWPRCPGRELVLAVIPLAGDLYSQASCPSVSPGNPWTPGVGSPSPSARLEVMMRAANSRHSPEEGIRITPASQTRRGPNEEGPPSQPSPTRVHCSLSSHTAGGPEACSRSSQGQL